MAETTGGELGQGSGQGDSSAAGKARPGNRRFAQWSRDYTRLPGIPDEFIAGDDAPRPVWTRFLEAFAALSPVEIERRFGAADRHMREAGVSYRAPGESADRHWPLSHLPLLIDEAEWQLLSAGIAQRAQLDGARAERPLRRGAPGRGWRDPRRRDRRLSDYLRPVCGVKPPGGRWLQIYAADLGRGPDGRWWVLADRTQAPSGAGYELENRLVISRAFPALYNAMNVERLAPFFEAFAQACRQRRARGPAHRRC